LSPVFRHGSLRLYLLKLLDEEPRHGYEVIRLLRDRFMGVYSPSPGTIYPRLARLEEEGLVTHDEVDGRKVYRITEAGREELRGRSDELDELEEELSASVSDIVREVREDVRQTVRSLREELTWAARESRRAHREMSDDIRDYTHQAGEEVREQARQAREDAKEAAWAAKEEARQARDNAKQTRQDAREEARTRVRQAREELRQQAKRARDEFLGSDAARRVHEHAQRLREEAQRARDEARERVGDPAARFTDDRDWGQHDPGQHDLGQHDLGQGWPGWSGWPGRRGWEEWTRLRSRGGWSGPDLGTIRDLERLAVQFSADLRRLAMQSTVVGENVISDLRVILEDALDRIKTEIFGGDREEDSPPPAAGEASGDSPEPPGQQ
jgi:DNA-binding PadR family transcriptional regulator